MRASPLSTVGLRVWPGSEGAHAWHSSHDPALARVAYWAPWTPTQEAHHTHARAPLAAASFLDVLHLENLGACDSVGSFRDSGLSRFSSLGRALLSALQSWHTVSSQ